MKHKRKKVINLIKNEANDLINEGASLYEEDEYQLSNDENVDDSDEEDHNTDDENSTDNDEGEEEEEEEENSTADSVSF